jgi:hypothetical protein
MDPIETRMSGSRATLARDTEPFVTIVSGLPRSGTSMMMRMLEAGGLPALIDNERAPDEDNPRGYYEFERVKQIASDASWLEEARGRCVKMVYRLLYDLPPAFAYRVIFMTRALDEVIASQDVMLRRHGIPGDEVDAGMLARMYGRQLQDITEWLREQTGFSVLFVDYHDVLTDPGPVVRRINTFLGGALDVDAMLLVPDWSLYRQRRDAGIAAV